MQNVCIGSIHVDSAMSAHLRCSLNRCHDVAARRTVERCTTRSRPCAAGPTLNWTTNSRRIGGSSADRYPRTVPAADPHGATDVRLLSDEPQADQHQYAGQDGEQEAI